MRKQTLGGISFDTLMQALSSVHPHVLARVYVRARSCVCLCVCAPMCVCLSRGWW